MFTKLGNNLFKQMRYSHIFAKVKQAPPDKVFGMVIAFENDNYPKKVNLGLGAYKDLKLQPVVLKVVRKVQEQIASDKSLNMEYIPIDGIPGFVKGSQNLIFGKDSKVLKDKKVASIQTLSGTGALRLGFELIKEYLPADVHIADHSWPNHQHIINCTGLNIKKFPYYNFQNKRINLSKLLDYLENCTEGDVVLLQVCAHNPTATDPTTEQWNTIADKVLKKKLVTFFDSTYQGLASANFEKDIQAVRIFAEKGLPFFVEQSYAKNMGMYGHRVGCLHVVTPNEETKDKVLSQLKVLVRGNYSSPPLYGARIAEKILNSEALMNQWVSQLQVMTERLSSTRTKLQKRLEYIKAPGDWSHLSRQTGFFVFSCLNKAQCDHLLQKYHIHMMDNGRMAMNGLNDQNIGYVAQAIKETVQNIQ